MRKIATITSRIFEPVVVFSVLILIALTRSGLSGLAYYRFIAVYFFLMVLPPMGLLVWAVQTKKIFNWDIGDRRERVKALSLFLVLQAVNVLLTWLYGNEYLLGFISLLFLWFSGFFLITLFWKISGHSGVAALGALSMIHWFGSAWWPVFLAIPLVSWARVVRRDHTVGQVIGGIVYSVIFLVIISAINLKFSIFNF